MAAWTPDDWGKFFNYAGDFAIKLLAAASPYLTYKIGKHHGQQMPQTTELGPKNSGNPVPVSTRPPSLPPAVATVPQRGNSTLPPAVALP